MRHSGARRRTSPVAENALALRQNHDASNEQDDHLAPVRSVPLDGNVRVPGRPRQKDLICEEYEAKLNIVKFLSLITSILLSCNWFLGFCALTWATVVVLGGFVSELNQTDFYSVSALLLLEAIRLALATFFGNIVTRSITKMSTVPKKIKYDDSVRHMIVVVASFSDLLFQIVIIAVSVVLPLRRWQHFIYEHNFHGLRHYLRIFYLLVLMNAAVATMALFHSKTIAPLFLTSHSLRRYYGTVVWRDLSLGLLKAHDFDFLRFAFKTQSDEYRRRMRPMLVGELYRDLIKYLYAHPKGFEAALSALNSDDPYEQEAAANIVGLWTKFDGERRVLRLQRRLLTELADMVDNQETGRAATVSFEHLAKVDREGFLTVHNKDDTPLVDIFLKHLKLVVGSGKYDRALVYVKALMPLLPSRGGLERSPIQARSLRGKKMQEVLRTVFTSQPRVCLKRTMAVAGYALRILTNDREPTDIDVKTYLRDQQLDHEEYILEDEYRMLEQLLGTDGVPAEWSPKLEIRNPQAMPISLRLIESIVAAVLLTLLVGFSAAAFIFRYIPL